MKEDMMNTTCALLDVNFGKKRTVAVPLVSIDGKPVENMAVLNLPLDVYEQLKAFAQQPHER